MTTIAWDGKILAFDSLLDCGGTKLYNKDKAITFDGEFYAGSGSFDVIHLMFDWIRNGKIKENFPNIQSTNDWSPILNISKKGLFRYERSFVPIRVGDFSSKHAIGSGSHYALGAMMAGKDAKEAVEIACKLDVFSGGKINIMEF